MLISNKTNQTELIQIKKLVYSVSISIDVQIEEHFNQLVVELDELDDVV